MTEFRVFRRFLRKACGLVFTDEKYPRVAEAVTARMAELGVQSFEEYHRLVTSASSGGGELSALATKLTVGETYFFRNNEHWQAFEQCVIPWLVELNAATGRRRIRIWSAGCSTGEEAYTMAIVLRRSLPDLANWSIEIVGTDISPAALAKANEAVYTENSFRGVPSEIRSQYFGPSGPDGYRLRGDIRNMVQFQQLNLLDAAAMATMRDFDVIFCRNVLIYFEPSAIQTVVTHFHRSLHPGGYLFLGHAESTYGRSPGFASLNLCNTFIYKSMPRSTLGHDERGSDSQIDARSVLCEVTRDASQRETSTLARSASEGASFDTSSPSLAIRATATPATCDDCESFSGMSAAAPTPPEPVPAPETPTLGELREQAIKHMLADETSKARQALDAILRQEPDDAESLLGKALLLAGTGDSDTALGCGQRVLDANPVSAEAYCVLALVHEGLGENQLARRELEKAIYLDNGFAIAHFRLACLHGRAGRKGDAMREFSNTFMALAYDDEQRIRLYSGGFDTETIARLCGQQLGIDSPTASTAATSEVT